MCENNSKSGSGSQACPQRRQRPNQQLPAQNGTRESPMETPLFLELLSYCLYAQLFLFRQPNKHTNALPYTFVSVCMGPTSSQKQKPEGFRNCLDLSLTDLFQVYLLFAPMCPRTPAVPNCPLPIRSGSSQGIFSLFICSFFPGNFTMHE